MTCRVLSLALFALFIGGCNVPNEPLPYPLTLSEEGLGALRYDTPFEQVNLSLSGFEFAKLSRISPDRTETIFQMKRGGTTIAHIVSDPSGKKISAIHILSPLIKNTDNLGLGDPLPPTKEFICSDNLCYRKKEPSVHYRIDPNTRTIREITFSRI